MSKKISYIREDTRQIRSSSRANVSYLQLLRERLPSLGSTEDEGNIQKAEK